MLLLAPYCSLPLGPRHLFLAPSCSVLLLSCSLLPFSLLLYAHFSLLLAQVAKAYGGGSGIDMTAFPDVTFAEPKIDSINISVA